MAYANEIDLAVTWSERGFYYLDCHAVCDLPATVEAHEELAREEGWDGIDPACLSEFNFYDLGREFPSYFSDFYHRVVEKLGNPPEDSVIEEDLAIFWENLAYEQKLAAAGISVDWSAYMDEVYVHEGNGYFSPHNLEYFMFSSTFRDLKESGDLGYYAATLRELCDLPWASGVGDIFLEKLHEDSISSRWARYYLPGSSTKYYHGRPPANPPLQRQDLHDALGEADYAIKMLDDLPATSPEIFLQELLTVLGEWVAMGEKWLEDDRASWWLDSDGNPDPNDVTLNLEAADSVAGLRRHHFLIRCRLATLSGATAPERLLATADSRRELQEAAMDYLVREGSTDLPGYFTDVVMGCF